MKGPNPMDKGLRAGDAKPTVDVTCTHPEWAAVNKKLGCIDSSHGPFPFPQSDHHSGLRLVQDVPTRYVPAKP